MKISVKNLETGKSTEISLAEDIFQAEVKNHHLHSVVKMQLTNRRRGTASAKTRSEVRGGGKKPWAQKGTGRARAGSSRSPLWRGGGIVFGPIPKTYNSKLPKKVRKSAMKSALSAKVNSGDFFVVNDISPESHKTKEMAAIISKMDIPRDKTLIVIHEKRENVFRGAKNIPDLKVILSDGLNVYDLIHHKNIVCTKDALSRIEERVQ